MFYYPYKALEIALSQGHSTATQYQHYVNIPFEEYDGKEMRKWVGGGVDKFKAAYLNCYYGKKY